MNKKQMINNVIEKVKEIIRSIIEWTIDSWEYGMLKSLVIGVPILAITVAFAWFKWVWINLFCKKILKCKRSN